ncbi:MAG: T9SS type A sorting domain-containing protein, partial [Bacteroidaceae bacterium]
YPLIDGIQTVVAKRKPKVWLDQNTLSAEGLAPFTLKLYNVAGRLVKANQVLSTKQTFHITDLMPGTSYIVVIETANERFAMKFIK